MQETKKDYETKIKEIIGFVDSGKAKSDRSHVVL